MYETGVRESLIAMGCLRPDVSLGDSESLFDTGVIDSIGLMGLVTNLEQKFSVTIDQDALTPDNFDSIAAIARYLTRLRGVETPVPLPK